MPTYSTFIFYFLRICLSKKHWWLLACLWLYRVNCSWQGGIESHSSIYASPFSRSIYKFFSRLSLFVFGEGG
ncbi:hypothetical protein EV127DRAFT_168971 [Xylaria flabelliformis]|nr:hypothetical protein EV127DRAFT_168971 [Xylaria flabelliformis]